MNQLSLEAIVQFIVFAVLGWVGMRVYQQGREVDQFKLEVEREFTRKSDLKEMLRDALRAEIDPLRMRMDHAISELDANRRDINVILEKLDWPTVRRDDSRR